MSITINKIEGKTLKRLYWVLKIFERKCIKKKNRTIKIHFKINKLFLNIISNLFDLFFLFYIKIKNLIKYKILIIFDFYFFFITKLNVRKSFFFCLGSFHFPLTKHSGRHLYSDRSCGSLPWMEADKTTLPPKHSTPTKT